MTNDANIHEIRVTPKTDDPLAHAVERQAAGVTDDGVSLRTARVFYVEGVSDQEAQALADSLLTDPVTQRSEVGARKDWDNPNHVEVAPLPGVMNPETESIMQGAKLLGTSPTEVQSGTEYWFAKDTAEDVVASVVGDLLVNETVEQVRAIAPETLKVSGEPAPVEIINVINLNDDELVKLSKDRKLALSLPEMQTIQQENKQRGRDSTDVELEYLAGAWSEHCCHKTFNAGLEIDGLKKPSLFQQIKDGSRPYFKDRNVQSAFSDNSGVLGWYDGYSICIKLETHNHPMNIEPYGGSATGAGGVYRDIVFTGLGAKTISSCHMMFLAPLDYKKQDVPPSCHTPQYLMTRGVAGVGEYGNPLGIPTNNGSLHVHPNYRGKSSVLVGAMGIMPEKNGPKGVPEPGDLVVAVGGKTGRDGLHGATLSSEGVDSNTATLHSSSVQIGDPITEKKMFDATLEASELGLIRACTDCGAAGFASAVGEMGEDIGVTIDLANAPLKYEGLSPWEIFLSESQERGVLAIDPANIEQVQAIFAKHGSEASVLGEFGTPEGEPKLHVLYNGETVADLDYDFIKNGSPSQTLTAEWTPPEIIESRPNELNWHEAFTKVLSNGNVCSKEPIVRQYDHEVQGTSAVKPYVGVNGDGPTNASVMTPLLGKPYAVVQAHGSNPALCDLDPDRGSVWAYTEAMSNFVAAGGNPEDAILVNNYISATPTPRVMGALAQSVEALNKCIKRFQSPVISGKDSLSSTFTLPDGEIIESPYNLIITIAGKIPDVEKTVTPDIKKPGSTLVLIGKQDFESMGGSVYYDEMGGSSGVVPNIDIDTFYDTARGLHDAIQTGDVLSAHDVSEGGLAVTVSEMLFGGDCGAMLTLPEDISAENMMFNETAGCFVVEVENEETAQWLFGDLPHHVLGQTDKSKALSVKQGNDYLIITPVETLKQAWKQPLEEIFS